MPLSSVRERLEVTASGLEELHYLRQRQEVLVRTALQLRQGQEENTLNCLRKRDAGLISQLQELDQQISDLRLDTDESYNQLETTDSRPSSGFYELSDGVSGSLSNSSNSVFSECFCSGVVTDGRLLTTDELIGCLECDGLVDDFSGTIHRSCSAPHPLNQDPVLLMTSCDSEHKYHCDPVVRNGSDMYRYPSPLHAVAIQSPSFLQRLDHGGISREERLLKTIESGGEGIKPESSSLPASLSVPPVPQSLSWAISSSSCQTLSHKRLNSYIYTLLQRKALPTRTSRPRTSINTEPSKSILRQASFCVRQVSGPASSLGTLSGCDAWWTTGERSSEGAATSSPQWQWSVESKGEEQETQNGFHGGCVGTKHNDIKIKNSDLSQPKRNCLTNPGSSFSTIQDMNTGSYSLQSKKSNGLFPPSAASTAMLQKQQNELCDPEPNSTSLETKQPRDPSHQTQVFRSLTISKTQPATPTRSPGLFQVSRTKNGDQSVPEPASRVRDSQSQYEAGRQGGVGKKSHIGNTKYIPTKLQNNKLQRSGRKSAKTVKMKSTLMIKRSRASEHCEPTVRKADKSCHWTNAKKSQLLEDRCSAHIKAYKRAPGIALGVSSSRIKRLPVSILGGRGLNKNTSLTSSSVRSGTSKHHNNGNHYHYNGNHGNHGHYHRCGRDQVNVVAKQKNKHNDTQHLRVIVEVPYMEAFRRVQWQQRKELLSNSTANVSLTCSRKLNNSYSFTGGSDSEYSAECASLFHSTIMDASEDETSNYTTNCFADNECSADEYAEENTTSSNTEASGTGGAGGGTGEVGREWSQLGSRGFMTEVQEMTPARKKAGVKIKASHNLKKRILRFRPGSLKLMTTV